MCKYDLPTPRLSKDIQTDKLRVVTSGHVTEMAVTLLDLPYPKTPCYTQSRRLLSFIEPELWAIKFYIVGIGILDVFGSCDLDVDPMTFICKLPVLFGDIPDAQR